MKIKQRPYHLLLITTMLLLMAGLISFNEAFDIHLNDTYFIVPLAFFTLIPSAILLMVWLLYLLTKKYLFSYKLSCIHIFMSIIISLFIAALPYLATYSFAGLAGAPRRYYDYGGVNSFNFFESLSEIVIPTFLILIITQLTFFINLFIGLYKRLIFLKTFI